MIVEAVMAAYLVFLVVALIVWVRLEIQASRSQRRLDQALEKACQTLRESADRWHARWGR